MILSIILLLQSGVMSPNQSQNGLLPKPLTAIHMRDIGCVATFGILAAEQRRGVTEAKIWPDVTEKGKIYAGIVGDRVVFESEQPKEAVALAIQQSAKDQSRRAIAASENHYMQGSFVDGLITQCLPLLEAELAAAEASAAKRAGG